MGMIDSEFKLMAPMLPKIAAQVEEGHYEEAAGNFYTLFGYLAKLKTDHGDWFEAMKSGGEASDLVFLVDTAAAVYCHLRQKENLPEKLAADMDTRLQSLDDKTGFFDGFVVSIYIDMLSGREYQMED